MSFKRFEIPTEDSLSYPDDRIGILEPGGHHYPVNSDLFSHHIDIGVRDLPDEVFKAQAEYYMSEEFKE